jgi:hypothetical protein
MPGDRLFIAEDSEVGFNIYLFKVTAPIYQLLGISELGANTARDFQVMGRNYNKNRRSR